MLKRIFCLLLAFFIVFTLVFSGGENFSNASGLNKKIDVLMDDFVLKVEGKGFSHREVFLYGGDLYLPISSLANALGLSYAFSLDTRILELDSKGKLTFDDTSKYPIAYQRGYEIDAKTRLMDSINQDLRNFLSASRARSDKKSLDLKTINVGFSDIGLVLDEKEIYLGGEIYLYNNDLYLPLTALSPYLLITPKLDGNIIDIDCNGVLKDKKKNTLFPSYYSIDELVAFREDLNNRYTRELEELNKKKKIIMDVKIPYEEVKSLGDMEKYINKHLGKIKDLDLDVRLRSASGNWYYVDVDFPSRYNYKWEKLSRRDVEAYVWDIYLAITSLYDEEAILQGNIKKYVSFDTKLKNIVFSFIDSGLDMTGKVDPIFIEELLRKKLGKFAGETFDYSARISAYDLELLVYAFSDKYFEKWSPYEQLDLLQRINTEIRNYYPGLKIDGRVVSQDLEDVFFTIINNRVASSSIVRNTSQYLNTLYPSLNTGGLEIPMDYSLSQIDPDNFKLLVSMDFLVSDSRWNLQAKDALEALMNRVLRTLIDIWDTNIYIEVYDKGQSLVYQHIISQDRVQLVQASPSSGEILEGSSVSLTTNSLGAHIYYTLDGSMPSLSSQKYSQPIIISTNTSIKAFAVKEGLKASGISTFSYTVLPHSDMASGLDSLVVEGFALSPSFSKDQGNYRVSVPYETTGVSIEASASVGEISIDGVLGESRVISISEDSTGVEIVHSEDGKPRARTYTIIINREDLVVSNVDLDPDYSFNVFAYGSFSGRLIGNSAGHEIILLPSIGGAYDSAIVSEDGEFEISGFPIDFVSQVIGYKYEIRDANDDFVKSGELSPR